MIDFYYNYLLILAKKIYNNNNFSTICLNVLFI